ncbi:hypothetical protein P9112_002685 [Eukaryota sp. TZLM1-RC]
MNDRTQVADYILSTSTPLPLPISILDKKFSDLEISANLGENEVCSRTKKRSDKWFNYRKQGHNARTCPNVEKNDVANSEKNAKENLLEEQNLKKN